VSFFYCSMNEDDHNHVHSDPAHPHHNASAMFPAVEEASFCSNFQCCGKSLKDLHALLQHYEESHVKIEESGDESMHDHSMSNSAVDFDTIVAADSLLTVGGDARSSTSPLPVATVPVRRGTVAEPNGTFPASHHSSPLSVAEPMAKPKRRRIMTLGIEPCDFAGEGLEHLSAFDNTVIRPVDLASYNSGRHGFARIAPKRAHSVPALPNFPLMNTEGGYQLIHSILSSTMDPPSLQPSQGGDALSGTASSAACSSNGSGSSTTGYSSLLRGSSERPFICPISGCGKTYKNANGLKYHALHGHDGELVEKPHKCPFSGCGKRYKNSNGLKYHFQHSHQNAVPPNSGTGSSVSRMPKSSPPEFSSGSSSAALAALVQCLPSAGLNFNAGDVTVGKNSALIADLIRRNPAIKSQIPALLKNLQQLALQKAMSSKQDPSVKSDTSKTSESVNQK
jgi:hypothetical protein